MKQMSNTSAEGLARVFLTWIALGVSEMSPLEFVQFIAAIFACVYSGIHIFKLLREMFGKKGTE